ncbi:hypothetical protein B566_EDAN009521 [Ephemera danica]|nr:hypothetical protein B566_EDAN009521 [Ephemera danica]
MEEMPVFPERESSILAVLKKKKPGRVPENDIKEHKHPIAITSTNHTQEEHTPAKAVSSGASADLLGLSTPPASQPAAQGNTGVLVDMLGELYNSSGSPQPHANNIGQNTYNPNKYNDLIQIGVKSEFRQNLGRLGLFYGNKTSVTLGSFAATLTNPPELVGKLSVQAKTVEPVLEAGAQVQQMINAECLDDYNGAPSLTITFMYNNIPQKLSLKLPLSINKFFEPTEMNGESFFARWKNLGGSQKIFKATQPMDTAAARTKLLGFGMQLLDGIDPNPENFVNQQRSQKIFKATQPMDTAAARTKLLGFGMQLLDGIDPNPENFVCAGIVHTSTQQIGCLLRLEPNKQAQPSTNGFNDASSVIDMYRLTVRSSKESVSQAVCDLLVDQF